MSDPNWMDLDAAAEMGEAAVKEHAWAAGREPTAAELDAGAELGIARAKERNLKVRVSAGGKEPQ